MPVKRKNEIATVEKKTHNRGGARVGAGRKPFIPTQEEKDQVKELSGKGIPQDQIAIQVRGGVSLDTIHRHFREELTAGKAEANSKIAECLFNKATGGDTTALIWWTKTQMRWSETSKVEHTGANGAPIALAAVDFRGLSDDELEQMQKLMAKATPEEN